MSLFEVYPLMDIEPIEAEGAWIIDKTGQRYLDLYGGHAVISIGHSHPEYVNRLISQLGQISFYSNSVQMPLQHELAYKLTTVSGLTNYQLYLCNSGTESNEVALRLAKFYTGKEGIIALKNGFHGRTAGSAEVTDSRAIKYLKKDNQNVHFVERDDLEGLIGLFQKQKIGAVILECIQGISGVNVVSDDFYVQLIKLCQEYEVLLIADEVQAGFGRTGKFFSFQHLSSEFLPDLITMAKGMGNGFPVGGVLINPKIKAEHGLLGSTFGGNYLACQAVLAVLDVIASERLMENAYRVGQYLKDKAFGIPGLIEVRGLGLMIGLEFEFPVGEVRKQLVYSHHIFTGSSLNANVLRILPPLTISNKEIDFLISGLKKILNSKEYYETVYIGK